MPDGPTNGGLLFISIVLKRCRFHNLTHMAFSSILRWISAAAESSRPPISLRKGIFRSSPTCNCYGRKLCARMMSSSSTMNESWSTNNMPSRLTWPSLMLPPSFEGGNMVYKLYSLGENKVVSLKKQESTSEESPDDESVVVGSSHGWLALFNQRNWDLFLSNPLSRRHIKLPPIHTIPIAQEYLRRGTVRVRVSKVIISCAPDDEQEEECRAMMILAPGSTLAFCCPGRSTHWTPIGDEYLKEFKFEKVARCYADVVYSSRQKLFFCVTKIDSDDLEAWDLRDPLSPRIDWSDEDMFEPHKKNYPWVSWPEEERLLKTYCCCQLRYLVFAEQSNQLFLVTRYVMDRMGPDGSYVELEDHFEDLNYDDRSSYPYKTIGFDVHKIDREGRKLSYMDASLDGLAIFVGLNHSFAMSAAQFPELEPNSIYYTDGKEDTKFDKFYGGHDIGIFDYENRTVSPCYYPCDVQSIKKIMPAPIWFTPSLH